MIFKTSKIERNITFRGFVLGLGENALRKLANEVVKKYKLFDEGQGGLAILRFSAELANF